MSPMQQMLLGVGAATKTYVDDMFSTYVYKGTGSALTINNGINMSGEGGMTWLKERDGSYSHRINDTERGANKQLYTNLTNAEATETTELTSFNNNGFSLGTSTSTNDSNNTYASWSFRKAKGFFDVVTYSGNGSSSQTVSHSLGCVPGMMIVKKTNGTGVWNVYHRRANKGSNPAGYRGRLNYDFGFGASHSTFDSVEPSATTFELGTDNSSNASGDTYVAYLFAGGESTAATARSVVFDNDADRINIGDASNKSSDLNFGSGDFTWECWIKADASQDSYPRIIHNNTSNTDWGSNASMIIWDHNSQPSRISFFVYNQNSSGSTPTVKSAVKGWNGDGQWHHVAVTRSGNIFRLFSDGVLEDTLTWTGSLDNADAYMGIGQRPDSTSASESFKGSISNVRIVKGTAVYTSSFRRPTEPLTNITNTKLLCCNNSSVTGSTVTPLTISANNSPTASTDSPFDDPAGFKFGENEDQGVVKCGSYVGSGSAGLEVNLGWEPQFVLIKRSATDGGGSIGNSWKIHDSMRGVVTGGNDPFLEANNQDAEGTSENRLSFTPTGFLISTDNVDYNDAGDDYVFLAIRRPDGYVGKPPELGTGVFAMDTGNGSSTIPTFDSGFAVDWAFVRQFASTDNWGQYTRLTGDKFMRLNTNDAQGTYAGGKWDSNVGWAAASLWDSSRQSWMWKRHAGFDVVNFIGDGVAGKQISHSLSKTPEMIWIKNRDRVDHWRVGHKGLNGGTNPWQYQFKINDRGADSASTFLNNTAPTSTHFTVGSDSGVNHDGEDIIVLLFATTDVSYVGSYSGGSGSSVTVTIGFQPRFLWAKNISEAATNDTNAVFVLDTSRGWASGDDQMLDMSSTNAQSNSEDFGAPTSTGFTLNANTDMNNGGDQYVFYAHA